MRRPTPFWSSLVLLTFSLALRALLLRAFGTVEMTTEAGEHSGEPNEGDPAAEIQLSQATLEAIIQGVAKQITEAGPAGKDGGPKPPPPPGRFVASPPPPPCEIMKVALAECWWESQGRVPLELVHKVTRWQEHGVKKAVVACQVLNSRID